MPVISLIFNFSLILENNSEPIWEVLATACLVKDDTIFLYLRLVVKLQCIRLFTGRENWAPFSVALPAFSALSKGFQVDE